ncbi:MULTISPECIES: SLC13 family permease [Acidobacteriaceae]|uniref:SLC13 family permease n=1 Tax=Acidobacteriaceae TaxID=204434 RepID=UPI0020B12DA9|nr:MULTISPECIES: SLC13 family permease [Acidobacteriaceae]MDW5266308.1 SLC13 family permease [Edaphobacter sp.]
MSPAHVAIWIISAISIALMLLHPRDLPEAWWIGTGAAALVIFRLIPLHLAVHAIAEGSDVYLFLAGMMLLAQLAHMHGVFNWLATIAIQHARGSRTRLFTLIYIVGTFVTIFLSNDATAVVLTPAVLAATRKSKVEPLPYLFICAFIANAASFVLPISNPANLVVFHTGMPPLAQWLRIFLLASIFSIVATYLTLRWYCRKDLNGIIESTDEAPHLTEAGRLTLIGIAIVAAVLLTVSAMGKDLGLPTCISAILIATVISIRERTQPSAILSEISWSVLPLVAGLFIMVEAINTAGALHLSQTALETLQHVPPIAASMAAAFGTGIGTNLINNLPLGLIAAASIHAAHVTGALRSVILVAIDLGPNLSVTGSLATILWLIAIRKEGLNVSAWKFLKAGCIIMPPALALATIAVALFTR